MGAGAEKGEAGTVESMSISSIPSGKSIFLSCSHYGPNSGRSCKVLGK